MTKKMIIVMVENINIIKKMKFECLINKIEKLVTFNHLFAWLLVKSNQITRGGDDNGLQ